MSERRLPGSVLAVLLCGLLAACHSTKTVRPDAVVVVKDLHITDNHPWVTHFARHTLIDYREHPRAPWWRVEIPNPHDGIAHRRISNEEAAKRVRSGRRVRVISQYSGAEGASIARQIRSTVEHYDDSEYRPWPGPNSNTFVETLLRETKEISAVLDHNAVGKDHGCYFGPTAGGTGIEVQATYLGAAVGLREGVELSVLGFAAGVGFWPPVIKIPVLPEIPMRR